MACLCINKHKIVGDNLNMLGMHISCMAGKYITLALYTNMTLFYTAQQLEEDTEFEHLLHNKAMDNMDSTKDCDINGNDDCIPHKTVLTTALIDKVCKAVCSMSLSPTCILCPILTSSGHQLTMTTSMILYARSRYQGLHSLSQWLPSHQQSGWRHQCITLSFHVPCKDSWKVSKRATR